MKWEPSETPLDEAFGRVAATTEQESVAHDIKTDDDQTGFAEFNGLAAGGAAEVYDEIARVEKTAKRGHERSHPGAVVGAIGKALRRITAIGGGRSQDPSGALLWH